MNKKFLKIVLSVVFIAAPAFISNTFAVGMGMGMGMGVPTPCGGPFPPCPIPLDSGIVLLLIAGISYGGYKLYCSLKKNPA
ncbi:MAG: PID-CTERM protein-sorting domain-containing protein [Bacteroidia bacterium]